MSTKIPGAIIILNGAPRSGKTSIARSIQRKSEELWMNLGVDQFMKMTPEQYQPGIGLRPGGERPELEPMISRMYEALYASIAAHSKLGVNVVVDVGHHDDYSKPLEILLTCTEILKELPVLFVGVHCPIEVIMERRIATWQTGYEEDGSVPLPIRRWQKFVHRPGIYDLEVDTSVRNAETCADLILQKLQENKVPTAFQKIYALGNDAFIEGNNH